MDHPVDGLATRTLKALFDSVGFDRDTASAAAAAGAIRLAGEEPVLPSSFAVGTAAQVSIAAAATAANALWTLRGGATQQVTVDMLQAAKECCGVFLIDGKRQEAWDKVAGLYPCRDGWIRLHTNFAHHRDGVLRLLNLPAGDTTTREQVAAALLSWDALAFESAAAEKKLVVAAVRTTAQWQAHPQQAALLNENLVSIERIGEAAPAPLSIAERPLQHVKVLDLTRILAGPACGRTLAAYGADVMLVNSPNLPNISAIADLSRGKRSAHLDLKTAAGRDTMRDLVSQTHIFTQGYRPGGLADLGFDADQLAKLRPGIVCVSLAAYGFSGPWANRRGFDSLVQTATGLNDDEGRAAAGIPLDAPEGAGSNPGAAPRALPMQILDFASGFLMAFGAQVALQRQWTQGGSWQVKVSLARTGEWLRSLGRVHDGFRAPAAKFDDMLETTDSGFGRLSALRHAAVFSQTPAYWARPSMPPGTDPPAW